MENLKIKKETTIHSVFADYALSNLDRDPLSSAVRESFGFSRLRYGQIFSLIQNANFLSSCVGLSKFRSVIDCRLDLQ
jgi:hypothetical protein